MDYHQITLSSQPMIQSITQPYSPKVLHHTRKHPSQLIHGGILISRNNKIRKYIIHDISSLKFLHGSPQYLILIGQSRRSTLRTYITIYSHLKSIFHTYPRIHLFAVCNKCTTLLGYITIQLQLYYCAIKTDRTYPAEKTNNRNNAEVIGFDYKQYYKHYKPTTKTVCFGPYLGHQDLGQWFLQATNRRKGPLQFPLKIQSIITFFSAGYSRFLTYHVKWQILMCIYSCVH